jgi:hypothetical protein
VNSLGFWLFSVFLYQEPLTTVFVGGSEIEFSFIFPSAHKKVRQRFLTYNTENYGEIKEFTGK